MRTLGLVILIFVSVSSSATERSTLRLGFIEFAPYYSTNKNGEATGHLINLARAVLEEAGYNLEARSYPPKRVAKAVVNGDVDLYFGLRTLKEFQSGVQISDTIIDTIQLRAYRVRDLPDVTQKSDLFDKTILIMRGYSYGDWGDFIRNPKNRVKYQVADTHSQALRILMRRPVDYLLDYKLPVSLAEKEITVPNLTHNNVFNLEPRIIVSNRVPDAENVLKKLEAAYLKIFPNGSGELKALYTED